MPLIGGVWKMENISNEIIWKRVGICSHEYMLDIKNFLQ
jgi:hypothetical protein